MTEVTLTELKADPPAPPATHKFETPYSEDSKADPKCSEKDADVVEFGLQDGFDPHLDFAGICAPKVAKDGSCSKTDHPDGYTGTPAPIKDTVGDLTHCQLVCTKDTDCVVKDSKCITITIGEKDQKMCLFNKVVAPPTPPPVKHHKFETPYPKKEGDATKCSESDADVVEFDTSDGKKAGICAPQLQDGQCPAEDHPEKSTAVPKSIKDAKSSHCELDCSAGQTCPGESKCTSVKTVKSQLFAMRLEDGGDCKLCLYAKNSKSAFLMSLKFVVATLMLYLL